MTVSSINRDITVSKLKQNLPKDFEKVVGKVLIIKEDVFARIYAFFRILVCGPWKDFWKNISLAEIEIANKNKLKLYNNIRFNNLKPYLKAFIKLTGYETYTPKDIQRLRQYKKDFSVYQLFEAVGNKDYEKIESILKKIEIINNSNYYVVLSSLKNFVKNKNLPLNIENLIKDRLKQALKIINKNTKYLPEKADLKTHAMLGNITRSTLILTSVVAMTIFGYVVYRNFEKSISAFACELLHKIKSKNASFLKQDVLQDKNVSNKNIEPSKGFVFSFQNIIKDIWQSLDEETDRNRKDYALLRQF